MKTSLHFVKMVLAAFLFAGVAVSETALMLKIATMLLCSDALLSEVIWLANILRMERVWELRGFAANPW
jgi:hypothetical protein